MLYVHEPPISSIPPPSQQAVGSIIEVIGLLERGDRKMAARRLEGFFSVVSPRLVAAHKLRWLNERVSAGEEEVTYHPFPIEYDWVHYADAVLRLDLAGLITRNDMLEAIDVIRTSQPFPMEVSPALATRYLQFQGHRDTGQQLGP